MDGQKEVLEAKKKRLIGIVRRGAPVPGNLSTVRLRCGKANCKCRKGSLHGPFWRLTWKDRQNRSAILYVPAEKLGRVEKAVSDYREARDLLREIGLENLSRLAQELKRK